MFLPNCIPARANVGDADISTEGAKNFDYNYAGLYCVTGSYVNLWQMTQKYMGLYQSENYDLHELLFSNRNFERVNKILLRAIHRISSYRTAQVETTLPVPRYGSLLLEAEALTLSNGNLATAKTLLKAVEASAGITSTCCR